MDTYDSQCVDSPVLAQKAIKIEALTGISIIIPSFNEEKTIGRLLSQLSNFEECEIIVSDGGSSDSTVDIIKQYPKVKLLTGCKGRAVQMNRGARAATQQILLFLHADSILPPKAFERIYQKMNLNGGGRFVGGRFITSFDKQNILYAAIESYTRLPWFSYGDQGFFVARDVFNRMQGYSESTILEDVDFYSRLRKEGKTTILTLPITTSSRRFERQGFIKQKVINIYITFLALTGRLNREVYQRWYPDIR